MTAAGHTVLIGGSGPSLATAEPARVPATAQVIRVNNFFLEPRYHLGRGVDCVYFSADPRAVRFYLATLRRVIARGEYTVRGSASHLPEAGRHRPPQPFVNRTTWPPQIQDLLVTIKADHGVRPTSGAMAMLHAYATGAQRLLLAGIDLYDGAKYSFDLPPRLATIVSPNATDAGYDTRLHKRAADLEVLAWLRAAGVSLERISPEPVADLHLPLAPALTAADALPPATSKPPTATTDWVHRDGAWSITALAAARAVRRSLRGTDHAATRGEST